MTDWAKSQADNVQHFPKTGGEYVQMCLYNAPIDDPNDDPNSSVDPVTEAGYWPLHGVNADKLKANIRKWRKQHDPDECPEDATTITYNCRFRKERIKKDQFYWEGDDFDIFGLTDDLKRMIGRVWYADGTFKHITGLKRKRGDDALSYRQTYILSVKVTENDRVTVAPKVYILMRNKSKASYIEALQKLQALHAEHNPEYDPLTQKSTKKISAST